MWLNLKKRIALLLALAMCLAALSACGSDGKAADPGFDAVAEAVKAAAGTEGMAEQSADYIANMFKLDSGSYADALVMIANMGTSIDEYGIFHGSDAAQAEALHTAVQDYLQLRLDAWMPEYMPEEFPKLQNVKVWTEGNYVFYAILGEDAKTAAGDAFTGCFAA